MNIRIGNKIIGNNKPCFIVAEISGNHNGNINNAKKLIFNAKKCGADAVKLQTYKPETITLNCKSKDFIINKDSPWRKSKTFWELYKKAHTPWMQIYYILPMKVEFWRIPGKLQKSQCG